MRLRPGKCCEKWLLGRFRSHSSGSNWPHGLCSSCLLLIMGSRLVWCSCSASGFRHCWGQHGLLCRGCRPVGQLFVSRTDGLVGQMPHCHWFCSFICVPHLVFVPCHGRDCQLGSTCTWICTNGWCLFLVNHRSFSHGPECHMHVKRDLPSEGNMLCTATRDWIPALGQLLQALPLLGSSQPAHSLPLYHTGSSSPVAHFHESYTQSTRR